MLRIAVIGDLHVVDPPSYGRVSGASRPEEEVVTAEDPDRYHTFTERGLPMLVQEVIDAHPDLVLHTGDLAQSGKDEPAGSRELSHGLDRLRAMGAPVLLCRGNHDGDLAWRDICGSYASARWDGPGVHILTLDDPELAPSDQFARLEAELAAACASAAGTAARVFLAAHEPAYAVARPFFTDRAYAQAIAGLAARFPIEVLFCGHTHNQAWSLHPLPGGRRWLQVKAAAVGLAGVPAQPLRAVRAICGGPPGCDLLWGYLEDSAPGWNELILDGGWAILRWHALGTGVRAEARWRRPGEVEMVQRPPQEMPPAGPFHGGTRVAETSLHLAGYGGGKGRGVWLGGTHVGATPSLDSFAPRLSVALPPAAVSHKNRVAIETAPGDRLLIGALAIESRLADGRVLRTPVDPWLYATSGEWDAWSEPRLCRVVAGQPITATLSFHA